MQKIRLLSTSTINYLFHYSIIWIKLNQDILSSLDMKLSIISIAMTIGLTLASPIIQRTESTAASSEAINAAAKNLLDMVSDLDYYKRSEATTGSAEKLNVAAKNLLDMVSDLDYYKRSEATTGSAEELNAAAKNLLDMVSDLDYYKK